MIWIAVGLGGALGAATRAFLTDVLVPRLLACGFPRRMRAAGHGAGRFRRGR